MYVWTFDIQMNQRGQDFSMSRSWLKRTWSSTAQQATAFNTQYGRIETGPASNRSAHLSVMEFVHITFHLPEEDRRAPEKVESICKHSQICIRGPFLNVNVVGDHLLTPPRMGEQRYFVMKHHIYPEQKCNQVDECLMKDSLL